MKLYTILRNLIQSIKNALQESKDYSDARGDYIVEEGTSGIWTYRKWASGIAECWGVYTYNTSITSTWGNAYEGSKAVHQSYPFTFIERPLEIGLLFSKGNIGHWTEQFETNSVSQSGTYHPVRPNSMSTSTAFELHLYVKGLWKTFTQVGGGNT